MKNNSWGKVSISVLLIILLCSPSFVSAEKKTIRVVVEHSSVRIKPDMGSEIIGQPEIGSLFEVEEKAQGWYRVLLESQGGLTITGNIHEKYVQEIVAAPKPENVKPESEKPVVMTQTAVAPKPKKSVFPWLIGALLAGGAIAVAVLVGGKDSGPPPPTHGSIQVNSNPTGAKIFHNGSDTGKVTNTTLTDISPGTHTIKLVREGYVDVEGQIEVTAGQTATFSRDLAKHTITVTTPAADALLVPGQEIDIRWTTGGGAAVHAAAAPGSTLQGAGVLDGGLAAQRAAVREQALNRRMGVSHGGVADDPVRGDGVSALRDRAAGRTDSQADRISQTAGMHGAAGSSQSTSARSTEGLPIDRAGGRFVPHSAAAEFSGSRISQTQVSQDDSRVLVLSNVGIKLYRGATEVRTIVARTNNTGSYSWIFPTDLTEAEGYKIRVYCADAAEINGDSPNFTIRRRTQNIRGVEIIYIPPGEFMMGSDYGAGAGHYNDTRPVHRVRITKGFWMGKYEVTQGQWRDIMERSPSHFNKGDDYPVEQVSWNDIQTFIERLNRVTGRTFRLPTEAEWEYACRARTTGEWYGNLNDIAWYKNNSGDMTHPVGRKQPNGFGLYDILGNVWEWVQDWYAQDYYSRSPVNDPPGPASGAERSVRGGSWHTLEGGVRAATRGKDPASMRKYFVGFRLAMTD